MLKDGEARNVLHVRGGIVILEEDVQYILKPMRAGLTYFYEVHPWTQNRIMMATASMKAKKSHYEQALMTAFDRITRALWPSVTYWDLLPATRRTFRPKSCNAYHKLRWNAFLGEYFLSLKQSPFKQ